MLRIIERSIADGSNDLPEDEKRVAVQIIRGSTRHNDSSTHVESREDEREQGTSPFVDTETNSDT